MTWEEFCDYIKNISKQFPGTKGDKMAKAPARPARQYKRTGPQNGTGPRRNTKACPANKKKK